MRRKDVHNPKIAIYRYIELPHTVCKVNEIYEDDNLWFDCSSKVWDIFLQRLEVEGDQKAFTFFQRNMSIEMTGYVVLI